MGVLEVHRLEVGVCVSGGSVSELDVSEVSFPKMGFSGGVREKVF